MHELGVVFHVLDQIEDLAKQNNVNHVNKVTLEIGTVTGVVDDYLIDCWKWACNKKDLTKDCVLSIEKIEAITHCDNCGKDYNTIVYGKTCPYCKSDNTYLIQGREFVIKEMEVV